MPVGRAGDTAIRVCIMDRESSPAMMMAMAFAQSMGTRWKASGRSYGVGCVHTGVFPKRNSPLYLVCFECVHHVRKRAKALLGALVELLVT